MRHSIGAHARGGAELWNPEPVHLSLILLHRMADVARKFRMALRIDEDWQVATDADRIEMVEKKETIATQQILNVVFGRHHQRIDASLLQELVEPIGVEWN